jgi:hypothetical protein
MAAVVADTSPLIALHQLGLLSLLWTRVNKRRPMGSGKRLAVDVAVGTASSVLWFLAIGLGHDLLVLRMGVNVPWGGDKGSVLWGLFVGLPLGATAGLYLAERMVYRGRPPLMRALVAASIPMTVSVAIGVALLDHVGLLALLVLPLIVTGWLVVAVKVVARGLGKAGMSP